MTFDAYFIFTATMLAAQSIQLGINDVVVAGGMESMSNAPKYVAEARLVEVSAGRGKPSVIIDKDESLEKFDPVKLRKLRPSFKDNGGTVTAGNASSIRSINVLQSKVVRVPICWWIGMCRPYQAVRAARTRQYVMVVALANQKLLSLPSVLRQRNGKIGVGGVCNGGGGASALVLELL
ncbi:hypothetical protein B296_00045211 [Ensete ventricosum]|uniref:Thiolase N-terminal domain-containing protein n=1 Tax=Ensete ventricosum TaxID=4639 RepID=A0A426XUP1_ENSVE|nr:hypothetical protein B296_00045211 [Ensete ventricosum]